MMFSGWSGIGPGVVGPARNSRPDSSQMESKETAETEWRTHAESAWSSG